MLRFGETKIGKERFYAAIKPKKSLGVNVENIVISKLEQTKSNSKYLIGYFFSIWVFFHNHSRITRLQGKGEDISLIPHYHFHLLHRHLDISQTITAESSPPHISNSRTRTGNLWFPSVSR